MPGAVHLRHGGVYEIRGDSLYQALSSGRWGKWLIMLILFGAGFVFSPISM